MHRPETPEANKLIDWVIAVFERAGAHVGMGFDLYRTFVEAGLPAPYMHFEAPVGGPESWAGFPYAAASFGSLLPLLVQFGIATEEEVDVGTLADRVRREVAASKRPLALPVHVTAWAQLPG